MLPDAHCVRPWVTQTPSRAILMPGAFRSGFRCLPALRRSSIAAMADLASSDFGPLLAAESTSDSASTRPRPHSRICRATSLSFRSSPSSVSFSLSSLATDAICPYSQSAAIAIS